MKLLGRLAFSQALFNHTSFSLLDGSFSSDFEDKRKKSDHSRRDDEPPDLTSILIQLQTTSIIKLAIAMHKEQRRMVDDTYHFPVGRCQSEGCRNPIVGNSQNTRRGLLVAIFHQVSRVR